MSFSHGANRASCREMIPGHIQAHPQNPQHSQFSLQTSASSYLPGQLITVTVRSSRDFMGFLLQARSMEGNVGRARTGVGARLGSSRAGPVLVGGSWTFIPPGTHTLRCLLEGDTLTHSDKQLKRNLSFVWRAPDVPMGDIRFYITVVQSYFVYWAGIESVVVRDGTTRVDGRSSNFPVQENEVTVLPALRIHGSSNNRTTGPAVTLGPPTKKRKTQSLVTQTEATRPVLDINSSVTLSLLQNYNIVSETDTNTTSGSLASVIENKNPGYSNTSLFSTSHHPFTVTTSPITNITVQNSTSLLSLLISPGSAALSHHIYPVRYDEMEQKHLHLNFKDSTNPENTNTTINPQTTITAATNHSFHSTKPPRPISHSLREPVQHQSSSVALEAQSSSSQPWRTSLPKSQNSSINKSSTHKVISQYQTSSTNTIIPPTSPTRQFLQSLTTSTATQAHLFSIQHLFTEHSPSHYQVVSDSPKPLPERNTLGPQTIPSQIQSQAAFPQTDHSQSDISPEFYRIASSTSSQPHSHTRAQKEQTYARKQHLTSVTLGSSTALFTSRFEPTVPLDERKGVKEHGSPAKIKTMNPVFASGLLTPPPHFSGSTQQLTLQFSSSTSTHTFLASSLVYHSATTPLHPLRSSTLVSTPPSFRSTFFTQSFSSSKKNQEKTLPAFSALPPPSPVSIPPHFPSALPSSPSPVQSSLASSRKSSSNSSNYPSTGPLFSPVPLSTPSSSTFTSPRYRDSYISSTTSLPSRQTSSFRSLGSSSSFSPPANPSSSLFHSTIPHSGPSPAPRRSLYNLFVSSSTPMPLQKLTLGQRLLIQNHMVSSNPKPNFNTPTTKMVVHPNPEPHPNLNPNSKQNSGHDLKLNLPKIDANSKHPSYPSETPEKEGEYPDIVPRHSAWELGMLLGCSAGLGMVLVVGVRYIYRQACGKQTEMTLNDREREYGRGERGLIHVQECGDLVRVRRIRENSFVLLAEYDILASPGD
ncbi:hypothetical protein Q8A73_012789 [Channa argus]|nr:hypothetical protein Q8A73_012789 [Channa argus]